MSKINIDKISSREGKNINISGSLVATTGSFTGNVSVANTLTYEDITNINSTGVVTARTGIDVTAGGIDAVGVVTATSFSGSGSNLTNIESGLVKLTASGTIPNGASVIMNTDGTVGVVTESVSNTTEVSPKTVFNNGSTNTTSVAYDSANQKVVVAYHDDGNNSYGTAVVGTVVANDYGVSISFGTPVVFNDTAATNHIATAYDPDNEKIIITYADTSNYGTAIVGTVSGTSITFGTEVVFQTTSTASNSLVYDSYNERIVAVYDDNGNSSYGTAIVGTVTGTNITFGTAATFNSVNTSSVATTYDPDNYKVIIAYANSSTSGDSVVGTVDPSDNSITFGAPITFNSANTGNIHATYDTTNNKVVVAYDDNGSSSYGTAIVGTVSGTNITYGSEVVWSSKSTAGVALVYDSVNSKVIIAFENTTGDDYGAVVVGTVSGNSISFDDNLTFFNNGSSDSMDMAYDSTNGKSIITFQDDLNTQAGTAVVFGATSIGTNVTTENFIGFAAESISNTATGTIDIFGGVNTSQTGLTTGRTHFIQKNGSLAVTADTPSVPAGTATSGTNIIINN